MIPRFNPRLLVTTFCLSLFMMAGSIQSFCIENNLSRTSSLSDSLKYIGHSFVKIKTNEGVVIYIDPFAVNEFSDSADVVLITHEHSDHNDLTRVHRKAGCTVIRAANAIIGGVYQTFTIGHVKITAVAAYNANHPKSSSVGYVVEFDGIRLYHAGDTGKIPEMADLAGQDITYAFLPMDATYTMSPEEATQAAAMIHAKHDIPMHTMPPPDTYSNTMVARFTSPHKLVVLPGASIVLQASTIRNVPENFSSIQSAINAAVNGDTVLVSPGVYYENINFLGKNIVVTSRFFEASSQDFNQSTVINGSRPVHADTASCVLFINHEDSTAILQGFTITGGLGTAWRDEHGAGVFREGGGILIALSAPTIRYNLITKNEVTNTSGVTSTGGGGIRAGDGNPKIFNNVISSNIARYGAGVVLNFTGAVVRNNLLTNNSGGQEYGGGALWMNGDGPAGKIIENNTIAGNKVVGVYVWQGGSIIRNSILWGNTAPQIGVRSGGPVVSYSDIQGGSAGEGNINQDPMFADTNYSLQPASPCIDAGDTAAAFFDGPDPNAPGNARVPSRGTLRNDIGAYGGPGATRLTNADFATGVEVLETLHPSEFRLGQNYPNPFNPTTTIRYELPVMSYVILRIYDLLGREVMRLFEGRQPAGSYHASMNARGMASGMYMYRLTV
ncbi:MAG: T9SS C-terminal target domain-containing protein, partial [Ignavibacteriae bacterium]